MAQPVQLTPEMLVPKLGDYLVERGLITPDGLKQALAYQKEHLVDGRKTLLGQILIELGLIDRPALDQAITEVIIQLRAMLQDANRQLEKRVLERTAELQDALTRLTDLSRHKANFVANISHELRTPLTHVKGYLDLLITGAMGEMSQEQAAALETMDKSVDRLERLIEDLIRFSLAERGRFTLQISPVDCTNLAHKAAAGSKSKAAEKNISLITRIPPQPVYARLDEEKIAWVISHLLENGIKFTPEGGQVTLSIRTEDSIIIFSVCDTGIGIPDDKFELIFEPFRQLDDASTRKFGGTGLGLSLVKQIVEAHGAAIQVKSQPGSGTCFEFSLPSESESA